MLKNLMTGAAAVALSVTALSGAANALVIDSFNTGPQEMVIRKGSAQALPIVGKLLDNAPGCATGTDTTACGAGVLGSADFSQTGELDGPVSGILGGYRDVQTTFVSTESGTGDGTSASAFTINGGGGTFDHTQGSQVLSNSYITWGGTGDQLTGTGLGSVDLTDGGLSDKFHLVIINADNGVDWSLELVDSNNSYLYEFSNLADINPPGSHLYIPFTIFTLNGIDMTDIEFIRFGANVNSEADFQTTVDFFETTSVPEPASLTLLGAGLMGLGYFGKRRKA